MGVEVQTSRVWNRAESLDLPRVVFVNMLDRERADFYRALEQLPLPALRALRRRAPADRHRARADRDRRPAAHDRLRQPGGRARERADGDPGGADTTRSQQYRTQLLDSVVETDEGADGALPRGRGARHRGGRARAQGRGHARRALPGRLRGGHEEPRHDGAARPARRGRSLAGEAPASIDVDGAGTAAFVFKTVADPFAGRINLFRVLAGTLGSDATVVEHALARARSGRRAAHAAGQRPRAGRRSSAPATSARSPS